ncbi:hypothetical protein ACU4HD_29145 [Cupriavidus basilensis]
MAAVGATLAQAGIPMAFDDLHLMHHRRDILRDRCIDLRPAHVQHIAERAECRTQRAVRLRHQVGAWLRREHVVVQRDGGMMECCIDGVRASRHPGPEPQLEVLQGIEAFAQCFEFRNLLHVGSHLHALSPELAGTAVPPLL